MNGRIQRCKRKRFYVDIDFYNIVLFLGDKNYRFFSFTTSRIINRVRAFCLSKSYRYSKNENKVKVYNFKIRQPVINKNNRTGIRNKYVTKLLQR